MLDYIAITLMLFVTNTSWTAHTNVYFTALL